MLLDLTHCPVIFSQEAIDEVIYIYKNKNIPAEYGLRVATEGGGCADIRYIIGFDKPTPDDKKYDMNEVTVLIDKKHQMFLFGVQINYVTNNNEQGFEFCK